MLFLEEVVPLEAAAEAIDGLAGPPDPVPDSVDRPPQSPHRLTAARSVGCGVPP